MSVSLPPLPDVGRPGDRLTGRSVVAVIADEHERLLALCAELADPATPDTRQRRLAEVVTATLSRHLSAEEQYLYPAVRTAVPDGESMSDREVAEDRAIGVTLCALAAADPQESQFARLAGTVLVQVRRHAEAADRELLPLLQQMSSPEDLVRLGSRVETAEEAAPTRPHPATPATPPWNKVVDPTIGVIDKVRDALSGRVTYPRDL